LGSRAKETPEEAGRRTAFYFLTEYIPGVTTEYEFLKKASNKPLAMSLEHFQTEIMVFGLHCLDRATFAHRGAEYRDRFMGGAFSFTRVALASVMPEEQQDEFLSRLEKLYNTRQYEYGAWKLPTKGSPKETLFWEFAKAVCDSAEVYNPSAVVSLSDVAFGVFKMMDELAKKTLL